MEDGRQVDLTMKMYQTEGDARLNCDWIEWLMGYPAGWTSLEESQESQPNNKTGANRLKMLGNAIVPQHAYHIGLAIKEDIKNG